MKFSSIVITFITVLTFLHTYLLSVGLLVYKLIYTKFILNHLILRIHNTEVSHTESFITWSIKLIKKHKLYLKNC